MAQASTSGQALQLTDVAHGEQTGWRRGADLIQALPYYDGLSPEEKQAADALIEEEMRRSKKKPSDYLKELPPSPSSRFQGDEILESEMRRVEAGVELSGMDTSRYNLDPPPPSKRNDVSAWRAAVDNAYAQLEHQYNRLLNLELLLKFGPDGWRAHNEALEAHATRLAASLAATRRAVESTNRERKLQQLAAGRELAALEGEYLSLAAKNADIAGACKALEREVASLRDALAAAQPAPAPAGGQSDGAAGGHTGAA